MRDASIAVLRKIGVECGGSNVQFAVNPAGRPAAGDRDEPARVALLRARLQGDRLPDRQGRGKARRRLHARRAQERDHRRRDAGILRAHDRLRGHEDPALHLREIPRRRRSPDDTDEVRGRGHGDRPHLPGVAAEGAARTRDRHRRADADRHAAAHRRDARRAPGGAANARRRTGFATSQTRSAPACSSTRCSAPRGSIPGSSRRSRTWSRGGAGRSRRASRPSTRRGCATLKRKGFADSRLAQSHRRNREGDTRAPSQSQDIRPVYKRVDSCAAEFASATRVPLLDVRRGMRGRAHRPSARS